MEFRKIKPKETQTIVVQPPELLRKKKNIFDCLYCPKSFSRNMDMNR